MIPKVCCVLCQPCCDNNVLVTIQQGFVGLLIETGRYIFKYGPGLYTINPCVHQILTVDMRTQVMDIPPAPQLTKDNVTVTVDCFCTYKVMIPELAVFKVENYQAMIQYLTQGAQKSIIAEHTLTELLSNRKVIEKKLTDIIDEQTDPYGLKVLNIGTQKILLPPTMERAMATVAESEKQKDAKLIDACANLESAKIFREAADELGQNPVSVQLQWLETMKIIGTESLSTIVVPDSVLSSIKK